MSEPFETGVYGLSGELRQLGPYRLLAQLATGGMGLIHLGRNTATGRVAALKTVLAPAGVSAEARRRFEREVGLARRVNSRYTARILDCDLTAALPWMAMEYIPAPSLEALVVQRGPLTDPRAVRWIGAGVARALKELHSKGIVHRDVKPLNLLLTADGPRVIDFGISHAGDLTSTRLTLGTVAFAAPEQAEGEASTPASDIYSLGITLYYLACGRLPYPDTQEPLQQLNHVRRAATDLGALPSELRAVIGDCTAPRPADRPTADQLVRRFGADSSTALPAAWSALIAWHSAEGRRLQRAADQSEAETVTNSWIAGGAGRTRHNTGPTGGGGAAGNGGAGRGGSGGSGPNLSGSGGGSGGAGRPNRTGGVLAVVAAVVGALILVPILDDRIGSSGARAGNSPTPTGSSPTLTDTDTAPDTAPDTDDPYEPAERPTPERPTRTPPPVHTPPAERPTYERPTREAPAPPPRTPRPPPTYWGAIAVGERGGWGRSWDHNSQSAARQGALSRCRGTNCKVLTSFRNGCGAVAHNRNAGHYWGGSGATRQEAENRARANAGGGYILLWQCTTRPR
ncbi:protein kinase [Streptomyces sp. XM4193]|uniref:protein kinase domain-containing protein n=1 Tax=Streptomyces sp. XM4193 TaxID=2929782 RepID=UPI001FF760AC|nr:protein kinase [Streptomyces sp. XM4193]MCK1794638.1 protein kinase [Streptomyces sp. XM4193]